MPAKKQPPDDPFAVKRILNKIGTRKYPTPEAAVVALQEMQEHGVDVVQQLVRALSDPESDEADFALTILDKMKAPCPIEPLLPLLEEGFYPFRCEAIHLLIQQKDPRVPEILLRLVTDEDSMVREYALDALAHVDGERAFGPLVLALNDPVWETRMSATYWLGKLGDRRALEPLISALEDKIDHVRASAAEALGELGDKRALFALQHLLQKETRSNRSEYADVKGDAAKAIERIKQKK
ncbi:MAG TPA: HEAT repeat domain-containing protein [Ktedonobacterales bacterium]|jgi:HEAT repeat protein